MDRFGCFGFVLAAVLILSLCMWAAAQGVFLIGGTGSPTGGWGGIQLHLVPEDVGACIACTDSGEGGEWGVRVEKPGVYTMALVDAYGFGPVIRPGIKVTEKGYNRVSVLLNLCMDLIDAGQPADGSKEYGQTFKALGTSITGIAFKDAERILISMHEDGPEGRQVGQTVRAATYYPHGVLPTVPGKTYYLRLVAEDGGPFKMSAATGNRYKDGRAHIDGQGKDDLDLAIRVQYDPAGQILRSKPGLSEAFEPARRSYGQTFTAKGNSLALFSAFAAWGDKPPAELAIRVFEGGPGGVQVGPTVKGHIAAFKPGHVPLVPGNKYYLEITTDESMGEFRMWTERTDTLPGGELHIDEKPVSGRDLAMVLVEYEPDATAPPPPSLPTEHRSPADGKAKIVWDVPPSNDICKAVIRRNEASLLESEGEGRVIWESPVFAQGRQTLLDTRLRNGTRYMYSIRTVDWSGNESEPTRVSVEPVRGLPVVAELLNADLTEPADFRIPYAWRAVFLDGYLPRMFLGRSDWDEGSPLAMGWTVSEGRERADMVFYQRVPAEPGRQYEFSTEVRLRNPWNSREMIITAVPGIDPTGGTHPMAKTVVWGTRVEKRTAWAPASAAATAASDYITVFLRGFSQNSREMETLFRNTELREVTRAR